MTPEERAKVFLHDNFYLPWDLLEAELAVAIRDAVAEEREACILDVCWMCRDGLTAEKNTDRPDQPYAWVHPKITSDGKLRSWPAPCYASEIRERANRGNDGAL